jgi:aminocarboxymuconate-semialdehyde decarboxylase
MTYDVHAHCVPADLADELGPVRPDLADVDARLKAMDEAGVDVQLLSPWVDLTHYELDAAQGERHARRFNEALAATIGEHPDRFTGLGTVPLQAPERAAEELRHAVGDLGMAGAEIATTVAGRELDDRDLDPFWAAAAELRCLVLLHPLHSLAGRGVQRYFLGNLVGNPAESTVAIAHLVLGGVLERFGDLRICVVHGGGFLPYQAGRLDRGYRAKSELTAGNITAPPSEALRRLYYDTVLHAPQQLEWLLDFAGPEHVVLGTDYPFEMGDPDPLGTIAAVPGLDDRQRHLIAEGNVHRLLEEIRR